MVWLLIKDREWKQMEDAKGKNSIQNNTEDLTYYIEIGRADFH